MSDAITQGEFRKFLLKHHLMPKGERKTLFIGFFKGKPKTVSFYYHKDREYIPSGTLSAMARQLGIPKTRLVDLIKGR